MANTLYDWSTTAASNSNADSAIALTGASDSIRSADDSMRAIMGRVKEFVADLGAEVTVGGSADAITITANAGYSTYADGMMVRFAPASDNTSAATLDVNSIGAKKIRKISSGSDVALGAGDLLTGRHSDLLYDESADSGSGAWILMNPPAALTDATKLPLAGGTMSGELNFADQLATRPYLKDYAEVVNAIGSIGGGTQDIDLESGNIVTGTVDTSTTTFTFSNPPASGRAGSFTLILTNGGSQTVNWPASVDWSGGSAPSLTSSGVDILEFFTVDGGTTWYGLSALDFS